MDMDVVISTWEWSTKTKVMESVVGIDIVEFQLNGILPVGVVIGFIDE